MSVLPTRSQDLKSSFPIIASLTQAVYDEWEQDEDGIDEELGSGGICDIVAGRIATCLAEEFGIDAYVQHVEMDCHTLVVAVLEDGIFTVDVPPGVYETGTGYTWTKRKDIVVRAEDVEVLQLSADPTTLHLYVDGVDSPSAGPSIGISS
jgi:hypothetical protein